MSVGSKDGNHDITIASDATSSPTTSVSLRVAVDPQTNTKRWKEYRRQPFVQRQGMGAIQFADKDPLSDLVFSQKDWSGGAFQPLYKDDLPNRIAKSVGLDMRGENVATLGMKLNGPMDFLIRNGDAETGDTTGWSGGTATTASKKSGTYGFSMTYNYTSPGGSQIIFMSQSLNHEPYRNKTVTFSGFVKRNSGGKAIRPYISDYVTYVGTQYSYGSEISSSSWTYFSVTRLVRAGALNLYFGLTEGVSGTQGGDVFFADEMSLTTPGGVVFAGAAQDGSDLYGAFGRVIAKWNESNTVWEAQYISTATISSLVQFNGQLFASHADGTAYIYGSGTSWTSSTQTAPGQDANLFVVTGGGATSSQLWKSISASVDANNHGVSLAVNPLNGGSWGATFVVGTPDTDIVSIHSYSNTLFIGKEEGLYTYRRFWNDGSTADDVENLTLEFQKNPQSENFNRGTESKGIFYIAASQQTLFAFDGYTLTDISTELQAPRASSDFGGRVRAMTSGPSGLWMIVDTPTTDITEGKTSWLVSLQRKNNIYRPFTIEQVSIGDIGGIEVNGNYLWAFGRSYVTDASDYVTAIYRWDLPQKTQFAAFDASPLINLTGNFTTPRWDGNLPDADKAFISCTLFHKANLDAEHTIVVKYGKDNEEATTTTLGTANTASTTQTTFYFNDVATPETAAIGKDIQLNITLNTDDTVSPELYGFAVHSMLSPSRVVLRDVEVYIGDDIQMYNLASDPTSKKTLIDNLETLEAQVYPVYVTEDLDGDGTPTSGRWKIISDTVKKVEEMDDGVEIWGFTMQKVVVA